MTRDDIEGFVEETIPDQGILLADGLDDAFLGISSDADPPIAVYSAQKCIEIFKGQGMKYEEASEYFYYNVVGAYVGEQTPLFIDTPED